MSSHEKFDIIIIGGGPAGTVAGAVIAGAGRSVLIIEKGTYPANRIGESLLPNGNRIFKEIGVWKKIERAGFIRKNGAEFETADGKFRVHNIFARGLLPCMEYTYQVERPRFDELLLEHAKVCGCRIHQKAATEVSEEPDGYSVETVDGCHFRSNWLIDASGGRCFLGRKWKLQRDPNPYPSRIAVYSHFKDVKRRSGAASGNIIITRNRKGWFWQIPISEETTSMGFVSLSAELTKSGLTPREWFQEQVNESPVVASRLEGAHQKYEFRTTTDYSHMYSRFCGPRYFLVGDAATFTDPVFSSGVYLGLESGYAAARAILRAGKHDDRPLTQREQRRYTRTLKRRTAVIRQLIDAFYDDGSFAIFMNPTEKFQLFPAVNSIVAGNTRLTFGLWWRYTLFRLICRLNRNYRLVPDVLKLSFKR